MVNIKVRVDRPGSGSSGTAMGALSGATAMTFVGGSVAVSSLLGAAPMFTIQAFRYAIACLLLLLFVRVSGQTLSKPRSREWVWLFLVTACGLVAFNIALVRGGQHAEPAVFGVAVACVPVLLSLIGPLLERRSPSHTVVAAAGVVTLGAALVAGRGHTDTVGLLWAVVVLLCEAGFTLLALPVLPRLGPWGVSIHSTWMAAIIFGVIGFLHEGPAAVSRLAKEDLLAISYLAVCVTAMAFLLWYSCVRRLGAGRAGLLTGVAPAAAATVGICLGKPMPGPLVWTGIAIVAAGLILGLTNDRLKRTRT